MFKLLIIISILIISSSSAFAWTSYQKGMSPSDLQNKANTYTQNDLFSNNNNNNPYSTFQSVYNQNSARNNFNAYSAPVNTYSGQYQGNISQQVQDPKSITNPYGQHGIVFSGNHPSNPYTPQKWNNPFSTFQSPYGPNGARNNNQYGVQYNDSYGNNIGSSNSHVYYSNSVTIPYGNSPYNPQHVTNPYGTNKKFN